MNNLRFDEHQFANRRNRPVSAHTGIAWTDYSRMATITRRNEGYVHRRAGTPAWAYEIDKVRRVIAACVWRFTFQSRIPLPETFARDWRSLKEAADREFERHANNLAGETEVRALRKVVEKCGGLAEMYAAVLWRSWRLGEDSVTVAEALHMTPVAVRVRLQRIRMTAKRLGFEE